MRRITNAVLGFGFVFGCTSYDDNIKINIQNYKTLTPENIETNLKIANLILDQVEFEEMYTNYNEDIEIEGLFNLYKNGVTLIENKVVELEVKGIGSAAFITATTSTIN